MKTIQRKTVYQASPEDVFRCLDDLGISGMHMRNSSMSMMGSKLTLQFLTSQQSGPGTRYRWRGKVLGMPLDFTVEVKKWIPYQEKVWETLGPANLILYSGFRMHLVLLPLARGTEASLSISYEKPRAWFYRLLSFFLADWYCHWCLKHMLDDCGKHLEVTAKESKRSLQPET